MRERESYPPGVPCWVDTNQPDPQAAVDFYAGLFGWQCEDQMPPGAGGHYYVATIDGFTVAGIGGPAEPGGPAPVWNTYVAVESVDQSTKRAQAAGATVLSVPTDVMDAGRMSVVTDTGGAAFSLWEANKTIGAQLVNEPGTWNFSDLNTRDTKAAAAFYGSLFDWEVETFAMEDVDYTIFRLLGYGDFLAKRDPDLRARLEANGGPDAFADTVAILARMTEERFPAVTPEHWSVTFAVDDADATASRAEALGGKVIVPPFDAAPVRMTVITDPQGATFTASKYQPDGG